MIAILSIAVVWADRRYPDAHPLPALLFSVLAPVIMVVEGLQ